MSNIKTEKTIDILRKRNTQIQDELDRMKNLYKDYEQLRHLNQEYEKHDPDYGEKKVSELIAELEDIKKEWMEVLEELEKERDEYKELIEDMRMVRGMFEV